MIRRWFAGPDGPMSAELLEVPADLFVQPYGPGVPLTFAASDTVVAECVQREENWQNADCYMDSR